MPLRTIVVDSGQLTMPKRKLLNKHLFGGQCLCVLKIDILLTINSNCHVTKIKNRMEYKEEKKKIRAQVSHIAWHLTFHEYLNVRTENCKCDGFFMKMMKISSTMTAFNVIILYNDWNFVTQLKIAARNSNGNSRTFKIYHFLKLNCINWKLNYL